MLALQRQTSAAFQIDARSLIKAVPVIYEPDATQKQTEYGSDVARFRDLTGGARSSTSSV